jgi:anthranilate/para-aminobenzoate synthase component I
MDTCIALRTMMVKDGVAYLQAGESPCFSCMRYYLRILPSDVTWTSWGIVFDSDPYEWVETMNKLGANMH